MSEKTGATDKEIEAAARKQFEIANVTSVLPPWPAGEMSQYHQWWVEKMALYARYLVPEGYCIVRESFVDATKALVGDYHEAAGVAVSGLGKMQDVELELEKMETEK